MAKSPLKTPGVYIHEQNAFPNSIVPVATAVPAFIGYTPQAEYEGNSYVNVPRKISSFADFEAVFCIQNQSPPAPPAKQYEPQYYLVPQKEKPVIGPYILLEGLYYALLPDPNSIYYLYNSIRLFYENGGGDAYIVSVGTYGKPLGKPMNTGDALINTNVQLNSLLAGLETLKNELEPTMYLCPDATLLTVEDNSTLMQAMLLQSSNMMTSIAIFDVIGGKYPDPILYTNDIDAFRNSVGANGLDFGTVYYPFIGTTITPASEIDYTNLFGGAIKPLAALINPPTNPNQAVENILEGIEGGAGRLTVAQFQAALMNASKTYASIMKLVLEDVNLLPPSGGMAGVITTTDNQIGVWQAPANTTIVSAVSVPIRLTDAQQAPLNVDAVSGKSINAIRFFNGLGILVWGARTLDGNSLDWKYLPVRRTLIFLEQSCKLAAQAYVFEPNNATTWEAVKTMISSFLTSIWKEGGLQGATPTDAFSVACGLGSTMTPEDILLGFMNVTVKVAVVHPAEFIVISFQQQMPTSS
ncbi:MAG: phage tail sheath C-terminal domain-containing protein [Flavobacteriaceae bacterium]